MIRNILKKIKIIRTIYSKLIKIHSLIFFLKKEKKIGTLKIWQFKTVFEKNLKIYPKSFEIFFPQKFVIVDKSIDNSLRDKFLKFFPSSGIISVENYIENKNTKDLITYSTGFYNQFYFNNNTILFSFNPHLHEERFILSTNDFKLRIAFFNEFNFNEIENLYMYFDYIFLPEQIKKDFKFYPCYKYKNEKHLLNLINNLFLILNTTNDEEKILFVDNMEVDPLVLSTIKNKISSKEVYIDIPFENDLVKILKSPNFYSEFKLNNLIFDRVLIDLFPALETLTTKEKLIFFVKNNFIIKIINK